MEFIPPTSKPKQEFIPPTEPNSDFIPPVAGPKASQYALMPIDAVRANTTGDDRDLVDGSGDSAEIYSQDSIGYFFKDQYTRTDGMPYHPVEIGRSIYGDKNLSAKDIHSRIQQDISTGEIKQRLDNAEWLQYGFTDKVATKLTELNNSAFVENISHLGRAGGEGLVKAIGGMYTGTASLILPEAAEEAIGLDKTREFLGQIDEFRQERINQDF